MSYFNYLVPTAKNSSKTTGDKLLENYFVKFLEDKKKKKENHNFDDGDGDVFRISMKMIRIPIPKDEIEYDNEILPLKEKNKLLNDLYQIIIDCYELYVNDKKLEFYKLFNDEIFGLEFLDQRKIALKFYKEIFKNVCNEDHRTTDNQHTSKTINPTSTLSKLDDVFKQKEISKIKLIPIIQLVLNLLEVNKFKKQFKTKLSIVDEILNYEIWKQIMIELNNEFNFEKNLYLNSQIEQEKLIEVNIPIKDESKFTSNKNYSKNPTKPFIDFIKHENKIEIERIIKTHYSDVRGVSLRYLIEFLKEEGVLVLLHGDATKFYNAIKILLEGKNIGAYTSVFDSKVFSSTDDKYINAKKSFAKMFKDIL